LVVEMMVKYELKGLERGTKAVWNRIKKFETHFWIKNFLFSSTIRSGRSPIFLS